jgi:hypothetical protein
LTNVIIYKALNLGDFMRNELESIINWEYFVPFYGFYAIGRDALMKRPNPLYTETKDDRESNDFGIYWFALYHSIFFGTGLVLLFGR